MIILGVTSIFALSVSGIWWQRRAGWKEGWKEGFRCGADVAADALRNDKRAGRDAA